MDRREFYRMTNRKNDAPTLEANGGDTRWSQAVAQSRLAAIPHGCILESGMVHGFPIHRRRLLHPDQRCDGMQGLREHSGNCGEAARPSGMVSFVPVMRSLDHHVATRQAPLRSSAVPTGFYAGQPPRTTAYVGLIAPSLVGRPVIQFRGSQANDREKRDDDSVVDLIEDDSANVGSHAEASHSSVSPRVASSARPPPSTTEPCFTTNGMMQMDLPTVLKRQERRPIVDIYPKDWRPRSYPIARSIGSKSTPLRFLRPDLLPPRREVINVISDDEDERIAAPRENNRQCGGRAPCMDRLQPLLDAIDILSSRSISEDNASATSRNVDGVDGVEHVSMHRRRSRRSLGDMSQDKRKSRRREKSKDDNGDNFRADEGDTNRLTEDNPYRRLYRKRGKGPSNDQALWNFLTDGMTTTTSHDTIAPPSESPPTSLNIPGDVCTGEEAQKRSWLQCLEERDVQHLVEHHGICGLAELLKPRSNESENAQKSL